MAPGTPASRRRPRPLGSGLSLGLDGAADEEPLAKGGHSLRKRARVDYTQEQIDDDPGSHDASRNDATTTAVATTTKMATTATATATAAPGLRPRRRRVAHDSSDDESDELPGGTAQKRRRTDSSPAGGPRTTPARRKSSVRKPASDVRDFIDPASDNDVQDTILVGVSMDEPTSSDLPSSSPRQSDQPSDKHEDSRPSTSEGTVAAVSSNETEPRLPEPHTSSTPVQDSTSKEPALGPQSPTPASHTPPGDHSVRPSSDHVEVIRESSPGAQLKQEPVEPVAPSSFEPSPAVKESKSVLLSGPHSEPQLDETTTSQQLPTPVTTATHDAPPSPAASVEAHEPVPEKEEEFVSTVPAAPEAVSSPGSTIEAANEKRMPPPPAPEKLSPAAATAPLAQEALPDKPTLAPSALPAQPQPLVAQKPQIHRLPQVDRIYHQAAHETPLAAYEADEVSYPSPWTEIKPSEESANPTPSSTPTPAATPTPTPPEAILVEDMWDGLKTLTVKEFLAIYRAYAERRKQAGLPKITMQRFRWLCAQKHHYTKMYPPRSSPPPPPAPAPPTAPTPAPAPAAPAKRGRKGKGRKGAAARTRKNAAASVPVEPEAAAAAAASVQTPDETPAASPAAESAGPTRAPTPAAEDEMDQRPDAEEDVAEPGEEEAESDGEGEGGAAEPREVVRYPKRQYAFRKVPDGSAFTEALKDPQEKSTGELYETLAACADTLKTWQDEYVELKKITDDEENAKRRQANDKSIENWERRQKPDDVPTWRRTFDDAPQRMPAPFDLKGVRAPAPYVDDPVLDRQRIQDRVMAQAYGFVYNAHGNSVGRQRPEEQRPDPEDADHDTRLRDRRQTQKAADASAAASEDVGAGAGAGVIIEGKRVRKPRVPGGGGAADQGDLPLPPTRESSRPATPVPTRPQRRRRTNLAIVSNSDNLDGDEGKEPAPEPPAPAKRRNRSKANNVVATLETVATPAEPEDQPKAAGRKRGRAAATAPRNSNNNAAPPAEQPKPKRQRTGRNKASANTTITNIDPQSFYSNTSPADTETGSRPSTSSSTTTFNTAGTAESSYSLRDKKKRNFAVENDPDLEPRSSTRKRARPSAAAVAAAAAAAEVDTDEDEAPKKKKRTVQRKKTAAAASTSTTATTLPPPPPATIASAPHTPMMHTFDASPAAAAAATPSATSAAPPVKKPMTKIKIINSRLGSAASQTITTSRTVEERPPPLPASKPAGKSSSGKAPKALAASAAPSPSPSNGGAADVVEKPYSEMSKSEKMSYSMRRRWARGEMQGAVEKRKHTLAKKAEAKTTSAADTPEDAATPAPGSPAADTSAPSQKPAPKAAKPKSTSTSTAAGSTTASGSPTPAASVHAADGTPLASSASAAATTTTASIDTV